MSDLVATVWYGLTESSHVCRLPGNLQAPVQARTREYARATPDKIGGKVVFGVIGGHNMYA